MPQLEVVGLDQTTEHVAVGKTELIIGREARAGLRLQGAKISRRHARIFWHHDSLWIEDLQSSNGVFVNGERLAAPMVLADGATITIGDYTLHLQPDPPTPAPIMTLLGQSASIQGQRYDLVLGRYEVGRNPQYLLFFDEPSISRHHATVFVKDEEVQVEDADSRNGTFVNEQRITKHALIHGDKLRFGTLELLVQATEAQASDTEHDEASHASSGSHSAVRLPHISTHVIARTSSAQARWPKYWGVWLAGCITGCLAILIAWHTWERHEEHQFEALLEAGVQRAQTLMGHNDWSQAVDAYVSVLKLDPLYQPALNGRRRAELRLAFETTIKQLPSSSDSNYPSEVLIRIIPLMSDPEADVLGDRARSMVTQAQSQLSQNCAHDAESACRSKIWRDCRNQAACAVIFNPDNLLGAALLDQAIEQLPKPLFTEGAPAEATRRQSALAARYPQPKVRASLLAYGAGDLTEARRLLRGLGNNDAATNINATIYMINQAQHAGEMALASGRTSVAIGRFEQAIALDAQLLPPGQPSIPGRAVLDRATGLWLREGESAFNRGLYNQALQAWLRGLQLAPDHSGLLKAVEHLEARAQGIFDAISHVKEPNPGQCQQLKNVLSMVRHDQPLYQQASEKFASCPGNLHD